MSKPLLEPNGGRWGSLLEHESAGRCVGAAASEAARPQQHRSAAGCEVPDRPGAPTGARSGSGSHCRVSQWGDGVPVGRPVRYRAADGQRDPSSERRADATPGPVRRADRRRRPLVQPGLVPRSNWATSRGRPDHRADQTPAARHPYPRHPRTSTHMNRGQDRRTGTDVVVAGSHRHGRTNSYWSTPVLPRSDRSDRMFAR